ncbi:MAG: PadR family transcriptional regulator [Chloroflexota bacterium]
MSIKYAILGFLSWKPLSGYDLKKLFEDSAAFHWSGNNNQIYKALVELHNEAFVTLEVQQQADYPPRKIYTITEKGQSALRQWVLSEPEQPQLKNDFFAQLAWADQLQADELERLLQQYQDQVQVQMRMSQERKQRHKGTPQRTPRETYLWDMIMQNWVSFYENEVKWIQELRKGLDEIETGGESES